MKKSYISVRCKYYKDGPAQAVLDHAHALRNGFTNSQNVHHHLTKNNLGENSFDCVTPLDAYEHMKSRYKEITGKKCRSDMNTLFEHVLVLSEERYAELEKQYSPEKVAQAMIKLAKRYAASVKEEYGFEPLSYQLHLDEGFASTEGGDTSSRFDGEYKISTKGNINSPGDFKRNIHIHVLFFNYSTEKKCAPLKQLQKRGKDANGKTNQLNLHFAKFQDIAAKTFKPLGFNRGVSKLVTGAKHEEKEAFVARKFRNKQAQLKETNEKVFAAKSNVARITAQLAQKQTEMRNLDTQLNSAKAQLRNLVERNLELVAAIKQKSIRSLKKLMNTSLPQYRSRRKSSLSN